MIGSRRVQAWLLYAAVWVIVALSYLVTFRAGATSRSLSADAWATLINAGSAALLGIGILRACFRIEWLKPAPTRFFLTHILLAVLFSITWMLLISIGLSIQAAVDRGYWKFFLLGRFALPWQLLQGFAVYGLLAGPIYAYRVGRRLQEEEARTARAEALRSRAELEALRAQLNPHFLFNTLHSLHALVSRDPAAAETGVERLGDLLRYTLAAKTGETDDVTLAEEWAFVETYLSLERLRLRDRLRLSADIGDAAKGAIIPAFTLQPLVENAVKYAAAPRAAGAQINVSARVDEGRLRLSVEDDGPGASSIEKGGVGLRLVRQRLKERYDGAAAMEVATQPGAGFRIHLDIPLLEPGR